MRGYLLSVKAAVALVGILSIARISAQSLSGQELMDRFYETAKPRTSIVTMAMVISKNGKELSRTLSTWRSGDSSRGEVERSMMKFLSPADIKGSGFLSLKKLDGSTESQLWLPALGRVRRLSSGASDQDSSFFGSDFSNRDIGGFVKSDFSYENKGLSEGSYVIEALPKRELGYSKLVYYIDSADFLEKKLEFYRAGKLAKTELLSYAEVQGYKLPVEIVMSSVSGSTTRLKMSDYRLDLNFDDQLFTERYLKQ